ncbi:DUF6493 family protein [Kaarinaea lacus]
MTPDELRDLVINKSTMDLAEALAPLTEKERRKLSKFSYQLYRKIENGDLDDEAPNSLKAFYRDLLNTLRLQHEHNHTFDSSQLAVVGLSSLTNVKRVHLWLYRQENTKAFNKIICDRRPDWLDDWLNSKFDEDFFSLDWNIVRHWIKDGLCQQPTSDGYIQYFANNFNRCHPQLADNHVALSDHLKRDPQLLDYEIWRLFEVENRAFEKDWYEQRDDKPKNYESWTTALIRLADQGYLDRWRLLQESLNALYRGLPQNIQSGFHKFHLALKPTLAEIKKHENDYVDLLNSPIGHVVTFALKMLARLEKSKQLHYKKLIQNAQSVFSLTAKSQPIALMKILNRVAKEDKDTHAAIQKLLVQALSHGSQDVQQYALDALATLSVEKKELQNGLQSRWEFIVPALRSQAQSLLGDNAAQFALASTNQSLSDLQAELLELSEEIRQLPPRMQQRLGLSQYQNPEAYTKLPPPFSPAITELRVLAKADLIVPIESIEELIDAILHAVEVVESIDEVERILDGVSRLCNQRPDDFVLKTQALLKRIDNPPYAEAAKGLVSSTCEYSIVLNDLLHTWITGKLYKSPTTTHHQNDSVIHFLKKRIRELNERIHEKQVAPLLSAPTHRFGWIDPLKLVQRLRHLLENNITIPWYDFTQALLRMAPDNRRTALIEIKSLQGIHANIMSWALGGELGPSAPDKKFALLWVVASRARDPSGSFSTSLAPLNLGLTLPDTLEPAHYHWQALMQTTTYYVTTISHANIRFHVNTSANSLDLNCEEQAKNQRGRAVDSKMARGLKNVFAAVKDVMHESNILTHPSQLPMALLNEFPAVRYWYESPFTSPWLIHAVSMVWPLKKDASYIRGIKHLIARLNNNASSWSPNFAYLEPLFERQQPLTEMAYLIVWVALVGRDADARGIASDLLIDAIEDGRVHTDTFATVLNRLAVPGWLKLNRLVESLQKVGAVSPLHCCVVTEVLQAYLISQIEFPRNSHLLLELLLNNYNELQMSPHADLKDKLAQQTGGSKVAKLSRAIVQINEQQPIVQRQKAITQAVRARLNWQQEFIET